MSRFRRVWLHAAALLVAAATVGSFFGASVVAHNDAQRSKASFTTTSMEIAASLKLSIQQENSLAISAQSFVSPTPMPPTTNFLSWIGTMEVAKLSRGQRIGIHRRCPARTALPVHCPHERASTTGVLPDHTAGSPSLLLSPFSYLHQRRPRRASWLRRVRRVRVPL